MTVSTIDSEQNIQTVFNIGKSQCQFAETETDDLLAS